MAQTAKKTSRMLISKARDTYKEIDAGKTSTGSFFTKRKVWLTRPVLDFIEQSVKSNQNILDPFVGDGHLLDVCADKFKVTVFGYDIRPTRYQLNDSLLKIPTPTNSVIVTNPPYLAKYSAKRKGVLEDVQKYFDSGWEDLYQLALERCLESATYSVAIVPETFLNSVFSKEFLSLACVLEENPFDDTETPVCVACFDTSKKGNGDLYIGDAYCGTYTDIFAHRKKVLRNKSIEFNNANGRIALKAVDGSNPSDRIRFENAKDFNYSRSNIKVSSRLLTYLEVPNVSDEEIDAFVKICNFNIEKLRKETNDLILSPFKGNNKIGKRRRRLDYSLARVIIAKSLLSSNKKISIQEDLFNQG